MLSPKLSSPKGLAVVIFSSRSNTMARFRGISQLANAASVVAMLYYQSVPPYYLRQRGESASGSDTDRLMNMVCYLNANGNGSPIPNWRLKIAQTSAEMSTGNSSVAKR